MGIDDFLSHRTGGGRGAYLKNWKKDGKVNTWLHTECLPMAVWKHTGFPRFVVLEDKTAGDQIAHVWSGDYVCYETEDVLKEQYKLDSKGNRESPPHYCPLCRLVDYVRRAVAAGRIPWYKPVFKFEGDVAKETLVLHAGGLFMGRNQIEDLDEEEVKVARDKYGVNVKELWKENCFASAQYLFVVVDDAHPESGLQKSFQKPSLGDAVKDVIAKERESDGIEDGDPTINPYAIQWQYRKDEEPKKMYTALRMRKLQLTPTIEKLIRGPAPELRGDIRPFNVVEMRALLEQHALVKLPWDDIFKVEARQEEESEPSERRPTVGSSKKAAAKGRKSDAEIEDIEPKPSMNANKAPKEDARPAAGKGPKKRGATARGPIPDDDDEHAVACEKCDKAMWDDGHECPHEGCDAKYDAKFRLLPEEEKPKDPRKRAAPEPEPSKPAPAASRQREPGDDAEEDVDDLPF